MGTAAVEGLDINQLATALAGVDVSVFGDDELAGLVVDTERLLNAAHALSAVALEEFERRGTWAGDGASSAAGWAAGRTGTATRTLRARVRARRGRPAAPARRRPRGPLGRAQPAALDGLGRLRPPPPRPGGPRRDRPRPPGRGARRRRVRGRGPPVGTARGGRRLGRPGGRVLGGAS